MTIEQIANIETKLYSTVLNLYKKEPTEELTEKLKTVFESYKQVHRLYSDLAKEQNEALKRGLFIQWYAMTEPSYLTGIGELDEEAVKKLLTLLKIKFKITH